MKMTETEIETHLMQLFKRSPLVGWQIDQIVKAVRDGEAAARENAALRERVKELEQKIEDEENAAWDRNTRE